AIVNSNEPAERLAQTIADASAYYLLGYTPTRTAADGKFHRIEVKVKRGGVRVLARRGYWAAAPEEMTKVAPAPAEPGLVNALTDLVEPKDGRPVDFWIGTSRGMQGLTRLTVSWEPAGRPGTKPPGRLQIEAIDGAAARPDARSVSRDGVAAAPPPALTEPQEIDA